MPEILQHDFTEGEVHDSTRLEITKDTKDKKTHGFRESNNLVLLSEGHNR